MDTTAGQAATRSRRRLAEPGRAQASGPESAFDLQFGDPSDETAIQDARWIGWRLRLLVGAALAACVGLFLLARLLAFTPHIDAVWVGNALGEVKLARTREPGLLPYQGRAISAISADSGPSVAIDPLVLHRSARWIVSDADRETSVELNEDLAALMSQPNVRLYFADGEVVNVQPQPRGYASLGSMFWLLCAMALALYLAAMVVMLARPSSRNMVYALMALCQTGNLIFIAVESTVELGLPAGFPALDMHARMAFDLVMAGAVVQATTQHPMRLPWGSSVTMVVWVAIGAIVALSVVGVLPYAWWWTQGACIGAGLLAIALLTSSYRLEPHPYAMLLRRFAMVAVTTLALLTTAIAVTSERPDLQHTIAGVGSVIWYVFFASLLLVVPFLSRPHQLMREFSLLAVVSTVATSLDLLFVTVFSLGQFGSLTLALFLSLGVYAGARQFILNRLLNNSMLTTERMFEQLYRIAREVEAHPQHMASQLSRFLRDLFEPLEVEIVDRAGSRARVVANGSTMLVPLPEFSPGRNVDSLVSTRAIVIRFAHRGRRLFTLEDARLTDRIVEQLRRAVAYDNAVEQGRSEERARLAQDLHDDIGARLLTLMYKAQTPEIEEYVRHTLQDLKTLTRGLAASGHRLSHACAEWKADLTQRLSIAHIELSWSVGYDDDVILSVVQWSALTRVLRELVSNAIFHAQATRVRIDINLERDRFDLLVADNGVGRDPQSWSHGLGLGGVRKRVKQLGGEVEWVETAPNGIACKVRIAELSRRR